LTWTIYALANESVDMGGDVDEQCVKELLMLLILLINIHE
jgi:hypothetical protein